MFDSLLKKIKKCIKEYYKSIIVAVVIYIIFMFPVNYYIITGGGIMEVGDRIQVENSYKAKGSFNLAYVTEIKGTLSTYALSYILPDWKRVKVSDYSYDNNESVEDINFRSEVDLLNVSSYAIKNAYKKANKTYTVLNTNLYVYYVDPETDNKFHVGDKIISIDNKKIYAAEEYRNIVNNHKENDHIKVKIKRKNKEKEIDTMIYRNKGSLVTGIYINSVDTYKTYPKVKIKFKNDESGPSGGLIEALDIYNKITKKDITKGLNIAGTGEIDENGKVINIGEVKYKLLGAVKNKADVFIVPNGENYRDCVKLKKKKNLKIKLIGVSSFDEAVKKLNLI